MNDRVTGIGANTQSATSNPQTLERTIKRIADAGCDHAEISLSRAFAIAGGKPILAQVSRLKAACLEGGLSYTVHAPLRINFYDTDTLPLQKAVVRSSLDIASEIGATLLNVHCGFAKPELFSESRDDLLARERAVLAELAEHAATVGVRLAVENTFPEEITGDVPDLPTLADQIRRVGSSRLCGCLDVSHASIMSTVTGRDLLEDIQSFAPVIGHLHLNDCFATPRPNRLMPPSDYLAFGWGDLHLPLGWGSIDWDAVAAVLRGVQPSVIILEVAEPFWEAGLADSVAAAREFAKKIAAR